MLTSSSFSPNDEVVIRFRLFADQLANGWGWTIDNLKIQVDDIPPKILHNHHNYSVGTLSNIDIASTVTDVNALNEVVVEYKINGGSLQTSNFVITPNVDNYTLSLVLNPALVTGDLLEYRIKAQDTNLNETQLPASEFFRVPVIDFSAPVNSYVTDFNTANTDFVGNLFSITTPSGFNSDAIHSTHSYINGFGLDNTSSYTYTLKKRIKISTTNSLMAYDEIMIAEFQAGGLKDYFVVEGSKDNGTTWIPFVDPYSSNVSNTWMTAFNNNQPGTPSMYKPRLIDLTENGNFVAGDEVIIRFRFFATELINAWGFAMDNLSIQGEVTGLGEELDLSGLSASPNPVRDVLTIQFENKQQQQGQLVIYNLQGQRVAEWTFDSDDHINTSFPLKTGKMVFI
ncbi:MAG: T9SS type A sorting domain-containing protein [Flammeovirgaceae bacterium]|nr:T9SS type A sorting domain-containing protein [Flammeovirgaceae bacterium]